MGNKPGRRGAVERVARLLGILHAVSSESGLGPDDLARRFKVTRRRIFDDLAALNRAGIRIGFTKGYRLQSNGMLLPVPLGQEEASSLAQAADTGSPGLREARVKVARVASPAIRELVVQSRLSSKVHSSGADPETARAMHVAAAEARAVEIDYEGAASRSASTRRVHPHGIFFRGTGWYVAAWDPERGGFRRFRMDRIARARLTRERFERRAGFELDEFLGGGSGVWGAKGRLGARIRVLAWAAPYVRSEARARGLPFEPWVGGEALVRVERGHADEVAWWVLQFAGGMEVLGPGSLRRRVAELARAALELHGGSAAGEGEPSPGAIVSRDPL